MTCILVLDGPNLNLLGQREPGVYGAWSRDDVWRGLREVANDLGVVVERFQSNHEGALVDRVHQAAVEGVAGVVANPGGLTHGSVSLRDAFLATGLPFVEVHVSNVHAREPFRRHSLFSDVAAGVVTGFGPVGYEIALRGLVAVLGCGGS